VADTPTFHALMLSHVFVARVLDPTRKVHAVYRGPRMGGDDVPRSGYLVRTLCGRSTKLRWDAADLAPVEAHQITCRVCARAIRRAISEGRKSIRQLHEMIDPIAERVRT
jgi:hypothetical protein